MQRWQRVQRNKEDGVSATSGEVSGCNDQADACVRFSRCTLAESEKLELYLFPDRRPICQQNRLATLHNRRIHIVEALVIVRAIVEQ